MGTEQYGGRMTLPNDLRSMAESVGLAMPQAATLMMEAADTIDRLDVRNFKLRKQFMEIADRAYELGNGVD